MTQPPEIIDIHPHILSDDPAAYPLAPVGGKVSGWAAGRPVTAEQLLAAMDEAGIAKAAVVQASTAYGYDNRYVLDSSARHPDRFVAVGCVDPLAPDAAGTVRTAARTPRFAGIRLFTTGSTMPGQAGWLSDESTHPFWSAVQEAGLPVCVQMRIAGIPQLVDVLERFPGVTVVLDHMAYPAIAPGREEAAFGEIEPLAKYPQVFLKLTMRNTVPLETADAGRFLVPLLDAFGSDRIAWGSNFPAAEQPLPELLRLAHAALSVLPEADRAAILSSTARRLYPALT
ncbi:amidohydrolase family protein [Actinacidiphila sp. bgisy144]|uniref:amidohydrolase family protein n=1 Tax=Actinacidiphila sp. bgisy144 TaxID=3413791 RepID=UPI003EBE19F0